MMSRFACLSLAVALAVGFSSLGLAADPPAAPKVSTFAPADDLIAQVDYYVGRLEASVENETEYADATGKIAKDANTLILLGLALGMHDTANPYQKAAPGLVQASQQVAAAKDFASAKAGVEAVKAALGSSGDPSALKWTKLASLKELMEQVPLINSALKRNMRENQFARRAADNARNSAALATIAQGSLYNLDETSKPAEAAKWFEYCIQMRDASAAVNAAVKAKDFAAGDKAMTALNQSCHDCHVIFHPEAEDAAESEEE